MSFSQVPKDIVAVDSDDKTYMFYVNAERKLSYLISPSSTGTGDYTKRRVRPDEEDIVVSEKTQQIAAIAWEANGVEQIRVYYVNVEGVLAEVYLSSDKGTTWRYGDIGIKARYHVVDGSSISATVAKGSSLRVFASLNDQQRNNHEVSTISVIKGAGTGKWSPEAISNTVTTW